MHKSYRIRVFSSLTVFTLFVLTVTGSAQTHRSRSGGTTGQANGPRYSDYRGVKIGMTASEARKILGTPTQAADDQDFYIVSENETVQVCYDGSKKVHAISVDYTGEGSGAPNYKDVVGENVTIREDGSIWRMLRYEKLGFWVSYNRTAGSPATITVTLQKIVGTARAN